MNSIKKTFSSFVSLATILWSVGGALLVPGMAQAATLSPGDLIKASGPAVYYYAADGKRYVFPNEKTYFSWYTGFSSVVTITDAELAAITIGGNVTIRPGSKLVKITTDPKTYAVTGACATLHWIQSETVAKALYGDSWNTRVIDVPDAFFVDYQVGSAISSNVHPDGQIVYYASDASTYYVISGGVKRKLTSAGISANKLNTANAVVTTITYSNGSDVSGYEDGLGKVNCGNGAPVSNIKGSVNVTLASDTPAGKTLPKNGASIELAKFNLAADSNDAIVTGVSVKRIGVGATSDFSNVYLYDGNGNRLTSGRTINSATNIVTFNGLNLSIPANSTKSVVVVGDLSNPSETGGQHAFEITDKASVVISGSGTVGGSFPARGNTFTVGTITAGTVTITNGTDPSDVTIGAKDVEIANFKLAASTNDIEIRRIALTIDNGGAEVSDFKLYQGTSVIGTASSIGAKDLVVFNLDPVYVLGKGLTKTFSLHATVGGRSGNTIKTYIENEADVTAVDRLYSSGAAVTNSNYDGTSTYYSSVATIGGQLTRAFNGPATGNITKGAQDAVLYKFAMTASDSDLDVRKLRVRVACTGVCPNVTDIKVNDADTGVTVAGPTSVTASSTDILFTDAFTIAAGKTVNLNVTGDVDNEDGAVGNTYTVTLLPVVAGDIKVVSSNQNLDTGDIIPNTNIVGNTMTVISSSLTVALASTPAASTVVKKQADVPTAGFVFTAGEKSDVTISKIVVQGAATTTGQSTLFTSDYFNDIIASCGLYDGDTLLKSKSPTSAGVMEFSSLSINLTKSQVKTLVVKCTVLSTITGTPAFAAGVTSVTAQDQDSNEISVSTASADNNLDTVTSTVGATPTVAQTLANNGTGSLTIATGSQPESTIILGNTDVKLAEFRATAINEPVQITKVHVTSTGDASSLTEIKIRVKGSTDVVGTAVLASGASSNVTSTLTTPIVVDKDATKTIEIWGMTGTVVKPDAASGAKSGNTIKLAVAPASFEAYGISSGEKLALTSAAVAGNTMVLRKSKPTVTVQSVNGTLSSGVQKDLIKFQVSADAAGDVAWKQIIFTVSTTTNVTGLTTFKLYRGTSDITTDSVGTSTFAAGVLTISLKAGKEEVVSGSGQQYTIAATPILASPVSGDSITTKIREESAATTVVTATFDQVSGYLTGGSAANSSFVWSDLSAPGSPLYTNGDWTNGVYVKDLTTQSALVY